MVALVLRCNTQDDCVMSQSDIVTLVNLPIFEPANKKKRENFKLPIPNRLIIILFAIFDDVQSNAKRKKKHITSEKPYRCFE